MRAIQVNAFGGPEVLRPVELPDPEPGPTDVIVRAEAIDTIFVETAVRQGVRAGQFGVQVPYVPGGSAAGTVVAVGREMPEHWLGRRVLAGSGTRASYAELVRTEVIRAWPVPDEVDLRSAAALGADGVTALGVLHNMGLSRGETVLILGAAGGMGTLLVQLALGAGAHVVGAVRGEAKLALVRKLGAEAVDYAQEGWTEEVADLVGGKADLLLDGVGGALGAEGLGLVADGGRVSAHGAASGEFVSIAPGYAAEHQLFVKGIADLQFAAEDRARFGASALEAVAEGRIQPVIGLEVPLEQAAEAHRAIEERRVPGKALLIP